MLQDQSRNRTPMPAGQLAADAASRETKGARAEAGIARMLAEPAKASHVASPTHDGEVGDTGPETDARAMGEGAPASPPQEMLAIDEGLVTAVKDARLLDAAMSALLSDGDRDTDEVPGFDALDKAHAEALATLVDETAEGLPGLRAKAAGLLLPSQQTDTQWLAKLGLSLARDLLGAHQGKIAPQADPIFAAIEECERLHVAWDAALALPNPPGSNDPHPASDAARVAFWSHINDVVLKTVPRTAEGCAALARYAAEHVRRWDFAIDEDNTGNQHLRVLDLIARSPLLPDSKHQAVTGPLPVPGGPEAVAAWHAAIGEHSRLCRPLHEWPELKHPQFGSWTVQGLNRALVTGEVKPTEFARLIPIATERELRMDAISHRLNIGALFALAYAGEYPEAQTETNPPSNAALLELGARYAALRPAYREAERRISDATGREAMADAEKHYDRASRDLSPVEVAIADARAHTLDGLAVKARCVWEETRDGHKADDTLFHGLIRDVLAVAGQLTDEDENEDRGDPPEWKGLVHPFAAVDSLDMAGLSTDVLIALDGVAETLAGVAGDTLNRGFCHKAGEHTAAGTFAFWIQEACGRVIDNAHDEAFRRLPTEPGDKGARRNLLEMVARRTVQSNDPALGLTFVRALNAETPAHA